MARAATKKVSSKSPKKVSKSRNLAKKSSVKSPSKKASAQRKVVAPESTFPSASRHSNPLLFVVCLVLALTILIILSKQKGFGAKRSGVPAQTVPVTQVDGTAVNMILKGVSLQVPEEEGITVELGEETVAFQKGMARGTATWDNIFAAQRTPSGYDVLGIVSINHGGSGTQQYLVGYTVVGQTMTQMSNSYMIGDRVPVQSISIIPNKETETSTVVVNYLERPENVPMVDPATIASTKSFTLVNHDLHLVETDESKN